MRGLREKRTRSGEKIRSAALKICRKRGGATTRASKRKAGRAGQEDGSATFENLYRVSSERSRRAVDALLECIEAIREGRELCIPPEGEAGEEGMRQSRNGYRIWKYYRK